jgi:hypothetical protein
MINAFMGFLRARLNDAEPGGQAVQPSKRSRADYAPRPASHAEAVD